MINQTIDSEESVLGSDLDMTVRKFHMSDNREIEFLPKNIGEKFPKLIEFRTEGCGLTVLRGYYFEGMGNLEFLNLDRNKISTIEVDAFLDLIRVKLLNLNDNSIEVIGEKRFVTMVNLQEIFLNNNKIKFLSPRTLTIIGGQLRDVFLKGNACIDRVVTQYSWALIVENCNPRDNI